jgi:hypothetical protein
LERRMARTAYFFSTRFLMMYAPKNPVPPVTKTILKLLSICNCKDAC